MSRGALGWPGSRSKCPCVLPTSSPNCSRPHEQDAQAGHVCLSSRNQTTKGPLQRLRGALYFACYGLVPASPHTMQDTLGAEVGLLPGKQSQWVIGGCQYRVPLTASVWPQARLTRGEHHSWSRCAGTRVAATGLPRPRHLLETPAEARRMRRLFSCVKLTGPRRAHIKYYCWMYL